MKLLRRPAAKPSEAELDALVIAGRAALEAPELERALATILAGAIGLVGGEEGSIQLLDPTTMTLAVAAFRGLDPQARAQVIAVGQGISGTVALTGQALLLARSADVDHFVGHVPKRRRIAAALCVPLRARDQTIGVLNVNAMRPGTVFTEHHLRLVTVFAETASLAIVNARLLGETQRHTTELELLRGATLRLGASIDLVSVVDAALREAMAVAASDSAFICVLSDDGAELELARFAGFSKDVLRSVLASPSFRRVDGAPDFRVVEDVSEDPVLKSLTVELWGRALALVPLRTPDGRAGGLLGVAIDRGSADARQLLATFAVPAGLAISNALLHRQVAGKEQELDTIVTALDLPIMLFDDHRCFRAINPAAAAAFRLSPEFEIGQTARGKLPPEVQALVLDRWDDVSGEIEVSRGAESHSWRVTAATIRRGRRAGARVAVLADVSSERDLERRKADFLAVVGHELRTPLTNIKGYAHTLSRHRDQLTEPARTQALTTIVTQSERLERLIEDLLFVARIERDAPPLRVGWEEITEVCSAVVSEVSRRFPARLIRFTPPSDEMPARTDRVKVEQILAHLLENAIKYSDEDRAVSVRLSPTADGIVIAVRDEGPGIYTGDLERIFAPFTQLDSSATRRHGGTGMGLYIAHKLAEALGGRLEVDSVLGKGSTFALHLPARPPAEHVGQS